MSESSDSRSASAQGSGEDEAFTIPRATVQADLDRRVVNLSTVHPALAEADRACRDHNTKLQSRGDAAKPLFVVPTFADREQRFKSAFDRLESLVTEHWKEVAQPKAKTDTAASGKKPALGTEGVAIVDVTFGTNPSSTEKAAGVPSNGIVTAENVKVDVSTTPNNLETYLATVPALAKKAGLPLSLSSGGRHSNSDSLTGSSDALETDEDANDNDDDDDECERPMKKKKFVVKEKPKKDKKEKTAAEPDQAKDEFKEYSDNIRQGDFGGQLCNIIEARFSIRRSASDEDIARAVESMKKLVAAADLDELRITVRVEGGRTAVVTWGMYASDAVDPFFASLFLEEAGRSAEPITDMSYASPSGGRLSVHTACSFEELCRRPADGTNDSVHEAVGYPVWFLLSGARVYADGVFATRLLHEYQYAKVSGAVESSETFSDRKEPPGVTTFAHALDSFESVKLTSRFSSPALAVSRVVQSWALGLRQVFGTSQKDRSDPTAAALATTVPEFTAGYLASECLGLNVVPQVAMMALYTLCGTPDIEQQMPFDFISLLDGVTHVSWFGMGQHLVAEVHGVPVNAIFPESRSYAIRQVLLSTAARFQHMVEYYTRGVMQTQSSVYQLIKGMEMRADGEATASEAPSDDEVPEIPANIAPEMVRDTRELANAVVEQERDIINDCFLDPVESRINTGLRPMELPGDTHAGVFASHVKLPIVLTEDAARATGRTTVVLFGEPRIGKRTMLEAWAGTQAVPDTWLPYDPKAPRPSRIAEERAFFVTRRLRAGENGRTANVDAIAIRPRDGSSEQENMQTFARLASVGDVMVFMTTPSVLRAVEASTPGEDGTDSAKSILQFWLTASATFADGEGPRPTLFTRPVVFVVRGGTTAPATDLPSSHRLRALTTGPVRLVKIASGDASAPSRVLEAALSLATRSTESPPLSMRDISALMA